jgi:sugar/nucleoside kinase (ribokinase family)
VRRVFDVEPEDSALDPALLKAAEVARANGHTVAWDVSRRWYTIALFDHDSKQLQPLRDEEAAILLNRDPAIRKAWLRWNAASRNGGSLIVLDAERALRILATIQEPEEDDEVLGLA